MGLMSEISLSFGRKRGMRHLAIYKDHLNTPKIVGDSREKKTEPLFEFELLF